MIYPPESRNSCVSNHTSSLLPYCPRIWALGKLGRAPDAPSPGSEPWGVYLPLEDVGDLVQAVLARKGASWIRADMGNSLGLMLQVPDSRS